MFIHSCFRKFIRSIIHAYIFRVLSPFLFTIASESYFKTLSLTICVEIEDSEEKAIDRVEGDIPVSRCVEFRFYFPVLTGNGKTFGSGGISYLISSKSFVCSLALLASCPSILLSFCPFALLPFFPSALLPFLLSYFASI